MAINLQNKKCKKKNTTNYFETAGDDGMGPAAAEKWKKPHFWYHTHARVFVDEYIIYIYIGKVEDREKY